MHTLYNNLKTVHTSLRGTGTLFGGTGTTSTFPGAHLGGIMRTEHLHCSAQPRKVLLTLQNLTSELQNFSILLLF